MSFAKAEQLMELATLAAARRAGITLDDVVERFQVSLRTAQRMMRALEQRFPDVREAFDEDGRKRWRLPAAGLRDLLTLTADEMTALDIGAQALELGGNEAAAHALRTLKDKVMSLVPREKQARLETDHDALLEAQGFVARPGPRPRVQSEIEATLAEAIKACRVIEIDYRPRGRGQTTSRVMPHGLLAGLRRYLVVRVVGKEAAEPSLRAVDRIVAARLLDESFVRDEAFDLAAYAKRSFGAFQSPEEYEEVVWRFAPEAAGHARDFVFHPDQVLEDQADGGLIVRFTAAGRLEMAWHLYMWGDKVEVLAPDALKALVAGHRRGDWPALP
ncbi:MAG: WYL domain-containing protein [Alphaproteobacteria bacterium]|nr:WYL domain-containing protein [Alphaproteobacteria bacterium]